MWTEIVKTLGGSAILVAALTFLTRTIILHWLNKDTETFKKELSNELAMYKNQLKMESLEHEVRFRRVDEKVAENLSELYVRLQRFYEAVSSYVRIVEHGTEPSKPEKLAIVAGANKDFYDFILPNRLYIPWLCINEAVIVLRNSPIFRTPSRMGNVEKPLA